MVTIMNNVSGYSYIYFGDHFLKVESAGDQWKETFLRLLNMRCLVVF